MDKSNKIKIGLAGFGVVGQGVYKYLNNNSSLIKKRSNLEFEITKILVKSISKSRDIKVRDNIITDNIDNFLNDNSYDLIIELIGGTNKAFTIATHALKNKKPLITANKALLAEKGKELFTLSEKHKTPIFFEAAVAGGIPIIKTIQESLIGNNIQKIVGIINGSCNYILSKMKEESISYDQALDEAQKLGYAESDPTLDVNGWDTAHKAIILASLAYGNWIKSDDVYVKGIENIDPQDIAFANHLGYTIKLLAIIKNHDNNKTEIRIGPYLIHNHEILASVSGVFNAIEVKGDIVGESLFYGKGAGQEPTASSVISDIIDAAKTLNKINSNSLFVPSGQYGKTYDISKTTSNYYLRLAVEDKPGVLSKISDVLGQNNIGILSVIQPENYNFSEASLVLMIHKASYGIVKKALKKISKLNCVKKEPIILRVENL